MTTFLFVSGIVLITAAIISAFSPMVDETDMILEQNSYETDSGMPKDIEIFKIETVEMPIGKAVKHKTYDETVSDKIDYVFYDVPLSDEIQKYIYDECLRQFGSLSLRAQSGYKGYDLPKLVMNIIRWESGFDASNDNGKCCGLMSVTHNLSDSIIEAEKITDLLDPYQNIRAGIHILKNQYDELLKYAREWSMSINNDKMIVSILRSYHEGFKPLNYHPSSYTDNILMTYRHMNVRPKEE